MKVSQKDVQRAAEALLNDEVIVFPTETAYGLGVNALSEKALEKLYALKGRDKYKPTHICVQNIDEANEYAYVDDRARVIVKHFLPGPLTLILKSKGVLDARLEKDGGVGIRVPDNPVVLKILEMADVPITATSANITGDKTPYSINDVKSSFKDLFSQIAIVLDEGELHHIKPSTIISLMKEDKVEILREGPISKEEILKCLSTCKK